MATIKPNFELKSMCFIFMLTLTLTLTLPLPSNALLACIKCIIIIKQGNQLHSVCVRSFLCMCIYVMFTRATIFLLLYFRKRQKNYTIHRCYGVSSVQCAQSENVKTEPRTHIRQKTLYFPDAIAQSLCMLH